MMAEADVEPCSCLAPKGREHLKGNRSPHHHHHPPRLNMQLRSEVRRKLLRWQKYMLLDEFACGERVSLPQV